MLLVWQKGHKRMISVGYAEIFNACDVDMSSPMIMNETETRTIFFL